MYTYIYIYIYIYICYQSHTDELLRHADELSKLGQMQFGASDKEPAAPKTAEEQRRP